jgi:hypothetical protein
MFEVKKHLIKVTGNRLYLPVAARLVWFRQEHPDWGIETKPIAINAEKRYAIFTATVYNAEGKVMGMGTKSEDFNGFQDYIEKAESGSIGRALAVCGFGTQFAPDFDEMTSGRVVDSPQGGSRTGAQQYPGSGASKIAPCWDCGQLVRMQPRVGKPDERFNAAGDLHYKTCGHGPTGFDENDRTPDPEPEPAEKPASGPRAAGPAAAAEMREEDRSGEHTQPASEHQCADCGKPLTKGQELLSIRNLGLALCPEHQKTRRAA